MPRAPCALSLRPSTYVQRRLDDAGPAQPGAERAERDEVRPGRNRDVRPPSRPGEKNKPPASAGLAPTENVPRLRRRWASMGSAAASSSGETRRGHGGGEWVPAVTSFADLLWLSAASRLCSP